MEVPNLLYIKELSGGDASFEESIITILKKEFPEEVLVFSKNFKSKNYIEAANNVHKLKHKISILGLDNGLELASRFEAALKKEETNLYEEFVNTLNKIHVYLEDK